MSKAARRLPRSLSQWLPASGHLAKTTAPPTSRLAHVLQHHFKPPHPAHIMPAGRLSHGHTDSASSNPRIAPYAAAPPTMQQQLSQKTGRKTAKTAGALLRGQEERNSRGGMTAVSQVPGGPASSPWVAMQQGPELPSAERPLQSAGLDADPAAKGKRVAKGRVKPREGSISPHSHYHFSCTSSVPDHGSSCFGEAARQVLQEGPGMGQEGRTHLGKGRQAAAAEKHVQLQPPRQAGGGACGGAPRMHTTYVLSPQHGMLPVHGHNPQEAPNASGGVLIAPYFDYDSQGHRSRTPDGQQQQQQQAHGEGRGSSAQQPPCGDGEGSDLQQAEAAARLMPSPGGRCMCQWLVSCNPCIVCGYNM